MVDSGFADSASPSELLSFTSQEDDVDEDLDCLVSIATCIVLSMQCVS